VAGGREWTLNVEQDAFEVTEFGSSGWKQFQPNLSGATVTISRYWNDSDMLDRLASTGDNRFVVELIVNSANGWRYEGFARVASVNPQTAVDAIVSESANFVIDGQLYFST
jgi:predicted secreted protein